MAVEDLEELFAAQLHQFLRRDCEREVRMVDVRDAARGANGVHIALQGFPVYPSFQRGAQAFGRIAAYWGERAERTGA